MTIPGSGLAVNCLLFLLPFFDLHYVIEMNNYFAPRGQFVGTIMPIFIERRIDLSFGAKALYSKLANCAGDKEHCWPSQAWLAEKLGTTVRSIQNYLRELVALGLIEVQRGRFGSTLKYYFVLNELVELRGTGVANSPSPNPAPTNAPSNAPLPTPDATTSPKYEKFAYGYANFSYLNNLNNKYKNNPSLPSKSSRELSAKALGGGVIFAKGFEEVWREWPEQVWADLPENRRNALRVWESLQRKGKLPPTELLLTTIRRFKAEDVAWGRGYAPRLANWLKAQGWADAPRLGKGLDKVLGRDAASTETGAIRATEPASEASIAIAAMNQGFAQVHDLWTKTHGLSESEKILGITDGVNDWVLACLQHGLPDMQVALESVRTAFGVSLRSWIRGFFDSKNMKTGDANGSKQKQHATCSNKQLEGATCLI